MVTTETDNWQSWTRPKELRLLPLNPWEKCPVPEVVPVPEKPAHFVPRNPRVKIFNTWTVYGTNINENVVLAEAQAAKDSGTDLDHVIVDDGAFTTGDTKPDPKKFPRGLSFVFSALEKLGFQAGLWNAPFLADASSQVAEDHPDWLIRDKNGKPINAYKAFPLFARFRSPKYLLDFENPRVTEHLHQVVDTFVSWGVRALKLDFLYAPYFAPHLKDDRSPHRALTDLFDYVRSEHPDVYTLACGCPFKPAMYRVDAIRIGPDSAWPVPRVLGLVGRAAAAHRSNIRNHKLENLSREFKSSVGVDPDVFPTRTDYRKGVEDWENGAFDVLGIGFSLVKYPL